MKKEDKIFDLFLEDFMLQEFKKEIIDQFPELAEEMLEEGKLANIIAGIVMLATSGAAGAAVQKAVHSETLKPQQAKEYVMKVKKENMNPQQAWKLLMNLIRLGSLAASDRKRNQFSAEQLRTMDLGDEPSAPLSGTAIHGKLDPAEGDN